MNKKQPQDERVVAQQNKIQSDGLNLLICLLLIAVLIQQFFMRAPLSQFLGEFICMLAASLYVVIRNLLAGNSVYPAIGTKSLRNTIISACIAAAITVILTGITNPLRIAVQFVCFIGSFCGLMFLCQWITARRQNQLIRQLEESEEESV